MLNVLKNRKVDARQMYEKTSIHSLLCIQCIQNIKHLSILNSPCLKVLP